MEEIDKRFITESNNTPLSLSPDKQFEKFKNEILDRAGQLLGVAPQELIVPILVASPLASDSDPKILVKLRHGDKLFLFEVILASDFSSLLAVNPLNKSK